MEQERADYDDGQTPSRLPSLWVLAEPLLWLAAVLASLGLFMAMAGGPR